MTVELALNWQNFAKFASAQVCF